MVQMFMIGVGEKNHMAEDMDKILLYHNLMVGIV